MYRTCSLTREFSRSDFPTCTDRGNVRRRFCRPVARSRRGSIAVLSLFLILAIVVLMGVVSDLSYINVSRSELSRTADSAALAGAWELLESQVNNDTASVQTDVYAAADQLVLANPVAGSSIHLPNDGGGLQFGTYDPIADTFAEIEHPNLADAVKINLRLTKDGGGEVPLFFGSLTGRDSQAMQISSIAAFQKNITGFYMPPDSSETVDILPIALDRETWESVVNGETDDNIAFVSGNVQGGSDGFHECSLYPQGTGSPGNRGTVDIGGSNNSTSDLRRQILHGISQQDFIDLGAPLEFNGNGELFLNGDTGISAGIKAQLESIIGQKRIIPIFETVNGNGNNATYTIVAFEGVRILDVKLTGPMKKKHLTIQPAPMVARHTKLSNSEVRTSTFLYAPVMLVQ